VKLHALTSVPAFAGVIAVEALRDVCLALWR
jgi:hypothetical protein